MEKTFSYLAIATLFFACNKSRLCTEKPTLKVKDVDQSKHIYIRYKSDNNYFIDMPRYLVTSADSITNTFQPRAFGGLENYSLEIKNDCKVFFSTNGINNAWDGTHESKKLLDGEYTYKVSVDWSDETDLKFEGAFTLLND